MFRIYVTADLFIQTQAQIFQVRAVQGNQQQPTKLYIQNNDVYDMQKSIGNPNVAQVLAQFFVH